MVCDKVRIRFRKSGDLRLVSHHDLMRCFERMLRRAELPFHSTSGFHPKPRLVFALSLPLGVVGCEEVVELELDAETNPEEVRNRLSRVAPAGLEILDVRRVDPRAGAQARRARYRIGVPTERAGDLARRVAKILGADECWVERTRPQTRRINVRPYIHDIRLLSNTLEMDLWITPTGSARAEEVLNVLGLGDLLSTGAILERSRLELHDETPIQDRVPVSVPVPVPEVPASQERSLTSGTGTGTDTGRDRTHRQEIE
jgi:radical SAM-linked protein